MRWDANAEIPSTHAQTGRRQPVGWRRWRGEIKMGIGQGCVRGFLLVELNREHFWPEVNS
jgi:hypothetical protein